MENTSDTRHCHLLCGIVVIASLLCNPFVEMGVNDDWLCIKAAQDLARTGHLIYNGWAAVIGAQTYWGAPFALLFGRESFTVVRLSMIPVSMATVALFYALCRRPALPRSDAIRSPRIRRVSGACSSSSPTRNRNS